jgi:hypothetical protein
MPTTPGQPGEKIYKTPQPPENHPSRGGFTAPTIGGEPSYDVGQGQRRRAIPADQMPAASQVGGAAGRDGVAAGRIDDGSAPVAPSNDSGKLTG